MQRSKLLKLLQSQLVKPVLVNLEKVVSVSPLRISIRDKLVQKAFIINISNALVAIHKLNKVVIDQFHEIKLVVKADM